MNEYKGKALEIINEWEAKDGGGNIVKDLTGHGYDAVGGSSNPTMMDTKWM